MLLLLLPLDLWVVILGCRRQGNHPHFHFFKCCCICSWELFSLLAVGLGQLEQPEISVTRVTDESAQISCIVSLPDFNTADIHWYRQKTNQQFEYLMYVRSRYNQRPLEGKNKKIEASKDFQTSTSTLKVNYLKKEDEATYYCALWINTTLELVGKPA